MRVRQPLLEVPVSDPFENDSLDRKDQVEALTNFLNNIEGPVVLAVDSAWGTGKTTFLRMLAQNLRQQKFQVAEFNAWETDFSKDPLISLFFALDDTLKLGANSRGRAVLSAAAIMTSQMLSSVPFVPDVAATIRDANEHVQTDFTRRMTSHKDALDSIKKFKTALSNISDGDRPVIICVDELDRCRPDYAIEFLENAKHIFDVDGVVFVLAVNMSELAHSVEALYGSNFGGRTYLRRFVDHVIYLPKPDRTQFVDLLLESVDLSWCKDPSRIVRIFFNDFVLEASHVSLRDIERAIQHLGIALGAIDQTQYERSVPLESIISILVIIRTISPEMYQRFVRGEASDLQVIGEMTLRAGRTDDWWKSMSNVDRAFRMSAIWEAILIGLGTYLGRSTGDASPLLEQRTSESAGQDNGFPTQVLEEYNRVRGTDDWKFGRALALVEMFTFESAQ